VLSVAKTAEDAGLDTVWVADHLAYPAKSESKYPYRVDGLPFDAEDGFLEAFTMLAAVAGHTERIGLGTSVLVLPMREVVLTAKVIATLDVLSNGRTVIAVGAGWWREEFSALGADFDRRGRRFDEQVAVMKELWANGRGMHEGPNIQFEEIVSLPTPVQPGGPRLLIGGRGAPAWRRAGTLGDGWHAVGADLASLQHGRAEMDRIAREAGRDPSELSISTSAGVGRSPQRAVERLAALQEFGVSEVALNFALESDSAADLCAAVEGFANDVLPELRRLRPVATT
jgi:probable F420-dependent oxidoreductase